MNLTEKVIKPLPTFNESVCHTWGICNTMGVEECVKYFLREIYHPIKEVMAMINNSFIEVTDLKFDDLSENARIHEATNTTFDKKVLIVQKGTGYSKGYVISRGYFSSSDPLSTFRDGFTSYHPGIDHIEYVYHRILNRSDYIQLELTFNEE